MTALADFFADLKGLAVHIEDDCHALKNTILYPEQHAQQLLSQGPSVEETLADLQTEVATLDDDISDLVTTQKHATGTTPTQSLIQALESMVQV